MPLRCAAAIALAFLVASHPASAAGVRLQVQAGVGGVVRASRWVPVRVVVDNESGDVSGELLIEWGDARLHRDVTLAAPSRLDIESYVRTSDVRSSVTVSLIAGGDLIATEQAPVRIAGDDDALNVCVGPGAISPSAADCTVTVTPDALPRSMRGYDAVDHLAFVGGTESALTRGQRLAIERWHAYHALESEDLLSLAPTAGGLASDAEVRTPVLSTVIATSMYLMSVLAACIVWIRRPRPRAYAYGAVALAVGVATAGAIWAGRVGPGSAIVMHQATTIQQVSDGSVVALRGTVEYPRYGRYALRATVTDGALIDRFQSAPEQWVDDSGAPVRRGTFGRGAREELGFEGVADYAPFRTTADGRVVSVVNVSDRPLRDCRFPGGFSRTDVGDLRPGAAVAARQLQASDAPFFVCRTNYVPVGFTDDGSAIRSDGIALVSVRLPAVVSEGAEP